jgi:hypothetical protein
LSKKMENKAHLPITCPVSPEHKACELATTWPECAPLFRHLLPSIFTKT